MSEVTLSKKTEMALGIKDTLGKAREFLKDNTTTILAGTALLGLAGVVYFGWREIPAAQEEIKRKKEVDPNASDLEIMAAALSKMKGTVAAVTVTGGCIIAGKLVSDSRLAAATAFGAAAFSDKKALEKKLADLTSKKEADKIIKEMHGENPAETVTIDKDEIVEGDAVKPDMKKKQEAMLNKLYRGELDWDGRELYLTPMRAAEIQAYIRKTYGSTPQNNFVGKPFRLNTIANLLGEDWGSAGQIYGYPDGDDFQFNMTPALNTRTGEIFMQIHITEPIEEWECPRMGK